MTTSSLVCTIISKVFDKRDAVQMKNWTEELAGFDGSRYSLMLTYEMAFTGLLKGRGRLLGLLQAAPGRVVQG